jgi:hypothetical protein
MTNQKDHGSHPFILALIVLITAAIGVIAYVIIYNCIL